MVDSVVACVEEHLAGKAESWATLHARSLRKLAGLPGKITVLPGYFSSLAEQNEAGLFASALELGQNVCGLSEASKNGKGEPS
ncbi:MAG TPA: hypothetical protein VMW54_14755 [Terriglobia bacterium]|nr:hypothetical protein [Terriglobia bacterium]